MDKFEENIRSNLVNEMLSEGQLISAADNYVIVKEIPDVKREDQAAENQIGVRGRNDEPRFLTDTTKIEKVG